MRVEDGRNVKGIVINSDVVTLLTDAVESREERVAQPVVPLPVALEDAHTVRPKPVVRVS